MDQGWIKLYRKIEQNDFLMTDNNAFIIFTKLLIFTDKHVGAYRTATRSLAKKIHMPHSTVYKTLRRLEDEGMITIEPHAHYSKIWITNWASYQSNREIDSILEHNVPLGGKRQKKQLKQIENPKKQTVRETHGKRTGNARETYNKNKEIEYIYNSTNVELYGDKKSPVHKDIISKLYYDAIKSLDLPVTNHNNLRAKIAEMARDPDQDKVIKYLEFMRDQYKNIEWEYKPHMNEALDIYRKRTQIKNTFQESIKSKEPTVWRAKK